MARASVLPRARSRQAGHSSMCPVLTRRVRRGWGGWCMGCKPRPARTRPPVRGAGSGSAARLAGRFAQPLQQFLRLCRAQQDVASVAARQRQDLVAAGEQAERAGAVAQQVMAGAEAEIGKSTRLNSSHVKNSYAVFCLKKKTSSLVLCVS